MDAFKLKEKWELISGREVLNGYKLLRISPECVSDIYVGVSSRTGSHCLILSLPKLHNVDFNTIKKEKISIELYDEQNYLILTLQDAGYSDLFDDLIISIYNAVKNISDSNECSSIFLKIFYKWSEFFEEEQADKLSEDIIKGIFGELLELRSLVQEAKPSNINDTLRSWRGPFDQRHDFVFEYKSVEVKTKYVDKLSIRIASEYQMENTLGKGLELLVVSILQDPNNGMSIRSLVSEIKLLVVNMLGDLSILIKALKQKGLSFKNVHYYDNYKFTPVRKTVFNCLKDGFPKIVTACLPDSINNVKYDINLSELDDYIILSNEY